jgi:hypothetical protein
MSTEVKQEGEFKIKSPSKPKKLVDENKIVKVELKDPKPIEEIPSDVTKVTIKNNTEDDAVSTQKTDDSDAIVKESENSKNSEGVAEEIRASEETIDSPLKLVEEDTKEAVIEEKEPAQKIEQKLDSTEKEIIKEELPEGVESLLKFMKETGGNVQDYARLNADYSAVDNNTLLREYYNKTKPHLDSEDINLILDEFTWDEEVDEDRDIRKKKIAFKEEVAKAKNFLEDTKSKYYEEIKLRPGVTQEQQKAMDFFNRYNKEEQDRKLYVEQFHKTTDDYFSKNFEGFDFNIGEKKFKYSIKDPVSTGNSQKDLTEFVKTFLNENGDLQDPGSYHKAVYTARNTDQIANHFYEQGRADAIKDQIAKSKNITTEPRKTASGEVFINGLKVRAISGGDSTKLKVKTKKFN